MAIVLFCDACGSELNEVGGLLFGPPDAFGMTRKQHLCVTCKKEVDFFVKSLIPKTLPRSERPVRDTVVEAGEGESSLDCSCRELSEFWQIDQEPSGSHHPECRLYEPPLPGMFHGIGPGSEREKKP